MEDLNLTFPIDMIKKEERIVTGIATADNIDKAGDIVEFEASIEAFKNWQGNIREMHAPIAVGKAIKYEPVKIKGEDGQEYNAMRVEAYISKGAQDTWEKILDGTLRSFSIGGKILQKEMDTKKVFRGKPVNVIKKYELGELSLVDNPANPAAVIDIVKFDTSEVSLDYILKIDCNDIDLKIPESVQRMAEVGLRQRKEHGRGGTSVGLGSARRLAAGGTASPEFVRKVARYFPRHAVDLKAKGANPGEDGYPSNGRIAWNLWGGTAGWTWARAKVRQLDNCTRKSLDSDGLEKCCCNEEFVEKYDIILDENEIQEIMQYMTMDDLQDILEIEKAAKTKRENGIDFPAQAFAYVPDPDMPSSWKLRLWETIDSKETAAQVGRAVAAIGKGFRGNVVQIPESDMGAVKAKIRRAWRKTHPEEESSKMPEVLKFDNTNDLLQIEADYANVSGMDTSAEDKLSLLKRFVNWLTAVDEEADIAKSVELASTDSDVEAENDQMEDQMDIDMLKDALGSVIDQKLTDFAASLKEEVEASVDAKIEEVTKGIASERDELAQKLSATEEALAEQSEKVDALASAGAMKKSVDTDGDEDDEELVKSASAASFWNEIYLPAGLVKTLGYNS